MDQTYESCMDQTYESYEACRTSESFDTNFERTHTFFFLHTHTFLPLCTNKTNFYAHTPTSTKTHTNFYRHEQQLLHTEWELQEQRADAQYAHQLLSTRTIVYTHTHTNFYTHTHQLLCTHYRRTCRRCRSNARMRSVHKLVHMPEQVHRLLHARNSTHTNFYAHTPTYAHIHTNFYAHTIGELAGGAGAPCGCGACAAYGAAGDFVAEGAADDCLCCATQ